MDLFIGKSSLQGDIARYAARFNALEVRSDAGNLPRTAKLAEWTRRVPSGFAFSVVLPKGTSALESSTLELGRTLEVADALAARWFLVQTPATVGPSARMLGRLSQLFAVLAHDTRRIAWESRSVWEDDQAEQFALEHGVHLVRDVSRTEPPDGPCVYTRLLALGDGVHVRPSAATRVAEALVEREEAVVIVEGGGAEQAARVMREELTQ
jgi:uncharacterized protein YecE (DUF72 family)